MNSNKMISGQLNVLLVEDEPILRAMMTGLLKKWGHSVTVSKNGLECVKQLRNHYFDLVLLDLQMPVMDGFNVLKWVRTNYILEQCQFIVLSTTNDESSIIQAFDLGADDYVSKPIEPRIFEAKLKNIVNRWQQSKVNLMLLDSLAHKEAQLKIQFEHEKILAEKIQNVILRGEDRLYLSDFNIASYSKAAHQVNGDFWEVYSLKPGTLDIVFGDVMGSGPLAAILAEQIKSKILRSVLDGFDLEIHESLLPMPSDIINRVHESITQKLVEIDSFVTLIYLRLDACSHKVITVSCGHSPALRLYADRVDPLGVSQLPLGVVSTEIYQQFEFPLHSGDRIFMASDGIYESRNSHDNYYQSEMNSFLTRFSESNFGVGALVEAITRDVERFKSDKGKSDDMTILSIEYSSDFSNQHCFSLKRDISFASELRSNITHFLSAHGVEHFYSFSCLSACSELFSNIVFYSDPDNQNDIIDWKLKKNESFVVVEVEYSGVNFDPSIKVETPLFNLETNGGLGLYMIQLLCENIYHENNFGVNRLVLTFNNERTM